MMIVFLGNNLCREDGTGVLADARKGFPSEQVLVVKRDGDRLQAPEGTLAVEASKFQPEQGVEYVVIANGGTSAQLVPVLKKLVEAGVLMRVFDLQRDGVSQLW
jgi:hypothetical protein